MNWLVTVDKGANVEDVRRHLVGAGCSVIDLDGAVPMSDDELAIPVTGPRDLPKLVVGDTLIAGVWENNDLMLM